MRGLRSLDRDCALTVSGIMGVIHEICNVYRKLREIDDSYV